MAAGRKKRSSEKPPAEDAEASIPYGEAVEELDQILESIDRDEVDVDELSQRVERAVQLIRICQGKLRATEQRVSEVLLDLERDESSMPSDRDEVAKPTRKSAKAAETPQPSSPTELEEEDDELPF